MGQRIVAFALVEFGRCLPAELRLLKPVQYVKGSFDAPCRPWASVSGPAAR
jgi:hypothetical protein